MNNPLDSRINGDMPETVAPHQSNSQSENKFESQSDNQSDNKTESQSKEQYEKQFKNQGKNHSKYESAGKEPEPKNPNPFKNPAKEKYLSELKGRIVKLPHEEYEDAVNYFAEYIEDAGLETYEDICKELGTPKAAANELLVGMLNKKEVASKNPAIVIIAILAILSAPVSIPLAFAMILLFIAGAGLVGGLLLALIAGIAGAAVIGVKALIVGVTAIGGGLAGGAIYSIGAGLLILGVGLFVAVAIVKLIELVIYLVGRLYYRVSRR